MTRYLPPVGPDPISLGEDMDERKIKEFQIGALHTKFGGGDDLPKHGDEAKMIVLATHLNADWHNTGRVEGHLVTQADPWEGGRKTWQAGDPPLKTAIYIDAPDGTRTEHKTVRDAMRALRAAVGVPARRRVR